MSFPRAILWSTIGVTLIYALMNFSILGIVPWKEIENTTHIVSDVI